MMGRWLPKRWWLWTVVLAFPVLWAVSFGLIALDPGGILNWAID